MVKEDIPVKFWREYELSDILDREDKIKHIVNNIDKLFDLKNKKIRKHTLNLTLRSYFDDLIEYMDWKKSEKSC